MDLAARAVEAGTWVPQELKAGELPGRFGFVRSPAATHPAREAPGAD
jgi:hypothetical protein